MEYSIFYNSNTGNTEKLAEVIKEVLPNDGCYYFGKNDESYIDAPLVFVGFWTNKGTCDDKISNFLKSLKNKDLFLFGTAGFGGEQEYYNKILDRVEHNIDSSNKIMGTYMCQGKMPVSIVQRYEKMLTEDPDNLKIKDMIDNFHGASTHPNQEDIDRLKEKVIEKIKI